jgi:hypothetical protein
MDRLIPPARRKCMKTGGFNVGTLSPSHREYDPDGHFVAREGSHGRSQTISLSSFPPAAITATNVDAYGFVRF